VADGVLSSAEVAAIAARHAKATPGPWDAPFASYVLSRSWEYKWKICQLHDPWINNPNEIADSQFIAASWEDMRALLADRAALTAARDEAHREIHDLHGKWREADRSMSDELVTARVALLAAEHRAERLTEALQAIHDDLSGHEGMKLTAIGVEMLRMEIEEALSGGRPAGGETP
jgi:hypothetical protein